MSFLTSREQVAPQGIGKPVRRREDARLLTGGGRFADDISLAGQAYAYMVRSPHAHARIASIDIGPTEQMPGVIAVLTGGDAEGSFDDLVGDSGPAHFALLPLIVSRDLPQVLVP